MLYICFTSSIQTLLNSADCVINTGIVTALFLLNLFTLHVLLKKFYLLFDWTQKCNFLKGVEWMRGANFTTEICETLYSLK